MITHYDMTSGEIIANSDSANYLDNTNSENSAHPSPTQMEIQLVPVDLISEQIEIKIPIELTDCNPTEFINKMREKIRN